MMLSTRALYLDSSPPLDEPQDGGVIGVFNDNVAVLVGGTVMGAQGEEFGAEGAALW